MSKNCLNKSRYKTFYLVNIVQKRNKIKRTIKIKIIIVTRQKCTKETKQPKNKEI